MLVRIQISAAAAGRFANPIELLFLGMRYLGAPQVAVATIVDMGVAAGVAPDERPCARRLREENGSEGSCDADLHRNYIAFGRLKVCSSVSHCDHFFLVGETHGLWGVAG
jgi:hypothetical protein